MSNEILQQVKDEYAKEKGYSIPKEGEYNHGLVETAWGVLYDYEYDVNNMHDLQLTFDEISRHYANAVTAEMKADLFELRRASLNYLDCQINDKPVMDCLSAGMELRGAIVKTQRYEQ